MEIIFSTRKLQKQCSVYREMIKTFGERLGKKLGQRLMEIKAASSLVDLSHLPPTRCHELENRKGVFSVDVEYPYRLLFKPAHDPMPMKQDGGIDRQSVTEIEVLSIEDTHDRKNQRRGSR